MKIHLGPAGIVEKDAVKTMSALKELGLTCNEIQFVYGVRMSIEKAKIVGKEAKKHNIKLSIHAPFYINLCSKEKEKIKASKKRILDSCERGHHLGARYIVFHAGFYTGRDKEVVYQMIKKEIIDLQKNIKKNKWKVSLAPETTGKESQFGSLDELLRLKKETGCELCIDFAHLYARNIGKIDYKEIFKKLKHLKKIHCHFTGIEYTQKGERNHLIMTEEFFLPLAKELVKQKFKEVSIISESPITWKDSLKMKKVLQKLNPSN